MMGPVRPISYVVLLPGPEARNQEHGRTRRLNQSFERKGLPLRLWHGSDSNVVLMLCRTKFINFWDVFFEMHIFDLFRQEDFFFLSKPISKVANIKPKSATIAFFSSILPPFCFFFSFPFPSLSVIFELIERKKPAF